MNKLRGLIYKFKQLKEILKLDHLIALYKALVESIIRYGIIGWGGVGMTYLKPLENIQKKIIKIIYKKSRLYPTDLLYNESKLFDVRQIFCYCMLIHQFNKRHESNFISHAYNTRNKDKGNLEIKKMTKSLGKKFFGYLAPKLYNMLPESIRNIKKDRKIKFEVKRWIYSEGRDLYLKLST